MRRDRAREESHRARPAWSSALPLALALVTASLPLAGCRERQDDGTSPRATDEQLPSLTIADDTPNLMLTWVDDKGETHVELHPPDVPAAGRSLVRVVVTDREDGTRDLFYVVDLTQKRGDGSYVAQTMPRRAWEEMIAKRRDEYLAKIAPPPTPGQPGQPGGPGPGPTGAPGSGPSPFEPPAGPPAGPSVAGITAIIYGADWCKPCHQAAAYLRSKRVMVVEKNVDESPAAQAEMRAKLEKSGQRGGSIPVIDVGGQILVGFSTSSLDRAIAKAAGGTVL